MTKLYILKFFTLLFIFTMGAAAICAAQDTHINTASPCLNLSVKVFLEGPYKNGFMTTHLTNFLKERYEYSGTGKADSILGRMAKGYNVPDNAVDVITIELRKNPDDPADTQTRKIKIASINAWLLSDGSIVDFETGTNPYVSFCTKAVNLADRYHVKIRHRNHISIMSSNDKKVVLEVGIPHEILDLTLISNIYGGGAKSTVANHTLMFCGDIIEDGTINIKDSREINKESKTPLKKDFLNSDANLDGRSNSKDYDLVHKANGLSTTSL